MENKAREIKRFYLERTQDVSGVSGTGPVAVGVLLPTGRCILEWQTEINSVGLYDSLEHLIHIHSHGGATKVVFVDERN